MLPTVNKRKGGKKGSISGKPSFVFLRGGAQLLLQANLNLSVGKTSSREKLRRHPYKRKGLPEGRKGRSAALFLLGGKEVSIEAKAIKPSYLTERSS